MQLSVIEGSKLSLIEAVKWSKNGEVKLGNSHHPQQAFFNFYIFLTFKCLCVKHELFARNCENFSLLNLKRQRVCDYSLSKFQDLQKKKNIL